MIKLIVEVCAGLLSLASGLQDKWLNEMINFLHLDINEKMVRQSIVYVGFSTLIVIFLHFLYSDVTGYTKFVLYRVAST